MISFCIFGYIYIQSEIDCAHDCVSALFVNDVFDSRTVGINDSLTTVRKLKEKGVEVYFQKENIYTLDSKGELLITIMSSLAQEESRSISENVTWGQRKRFADGKVSIAYSSFLGYQKGEDGQMEIVPEEAEIVRLIYRMFMQGKTPYAIAKYLMEKKIPTPTGKQRWQHRTIENILTNEKYKGDARLQKCYTVDFLSKKRKVNEGEVPQYYVEGSHDAIIAPAEWQMVQLEMERRRNMGRSHNCCGPFSAKLKCGDCGEFFGSKVWHSNSKYKRTIWQCNAKFKGESKCTTPHLYEQRIQELFLEALGRLLENRETIIDDCRAVMDVLGDCSSIEKELETVSGEMEVVTGLIQKLVVENATRKLDQNDYRRKYEGYGPLRSVFFFCRDKMFWTTAVLWKIIKVLRYLSEMIRYFLARKKELFFCSILDRSTRLSPHLLQQHGKIRHESEGASVFDGAFRHRGDAQRLYPSWFGGCGG